MTTQLSTTPPIVDMHPAERLCPQTPQTSRTIADLQARAFPSTAVTHVFDHVGPSAILCPFRDDTSGR